jgi:hypothetical protein
MRESGVRGILVSDYKCSHYVTALADQWADDIRSSDLEPKFICLACGKRGADVRQIFTTLFVRFHETSLGGLCCFLSDPKRKEDYPWKTLGRKVSPLLPTFGWMREARCCSNRLRF